MSSPILQPAIDAEYTMTSDAQTNSSGSFSPWTSALEPVVPAPARRRELLGVILLSVLAHTGFASYLANAQRGPVSALARPPSRVEVQFTRPPPPPPPPPTPAQEPPPPVKLVAPKPRAVVEPARPAAPAPPPVALEQREDIGIDAPEGEDGLVPKGSGEIGTAPPAPPAPPAPLAPPASPPPVIGAREGANYQKNPRPPYPALAVRKGWEGQTILRVQVLSSGRPGSISVQTSSGRDVLDEAAIAAVKGWSFIPATQGGTAIAGWVNVPIVFRLQ
jgi:protein TonB